MRLEVAVTPELGANRHQCDWRVKKGLPTIREFRGDKGVSRDLSEELVNSAEHVLQQGAGSWHSRKSRPVHPETLAPTKRIRPNYLLYI